jgi:predicted metal-binding protein
MTTATATTTTTTFNVMADHIDTINNRLGEYTKKAVKLGVAIPLVSFSNFREVNDGNGNITIHCDATMVYERIVFPGGWSIVGKIEGGPLGNIVYGPNADKYSHVRTMETINCDHCGHNRFRKVLYIVQNEEGAEKIVGSSCVKDFLGMDPSNAMLIMDIHTIFKSDLSVCQVSEYWEIKKVVEQTISVIESMGGVYRKGDTVDMVRQQLMNIRWGKYSAKELEHILPSEAQCIKGDNIFSTLVSVNKSVKANISMASDFEYKLANIMEMEYISIRDRGFNLLIGSIGFNYMKLLEAKRVVESPCDEVSYIVNAIPGSRVSVIGTVEKVCEVANNFGYQTTYNTMIVLRCGNINVRFYTTKAPFTDWKEGEAVKLSVKVKGVKSHPKYGTTVDCNYPSIK